MALNLDKKMLAGFSREVQSYLPEIREGIEKFRKNTARPDTLTEALRYIHTIKGASAMLGFSALSQATAHIEETLEDVVAGQIAIVAAQVEWLALTVDHIEHYVEALLSGSTPEATIVTEVGQFLQEFTSASPATTEATHDATLQESAPDQIPPLPTEVASATLSSHDEEPTLLMDTALALTLDILDAEPDAPTEIPGTADPAATLLEDVSTMMGQAEEAQGSIGGEEDFTADLPIELLDVEATTAASPTEASPHDAGTTAETPVEALYTAGPEVAPATIDDASVAALPGLFATPHEPPGIEDDFASDLLVENEELRLGSEESLGQAEVTDAIPLPAPERTDEPAEPPAVDSAPLSQEPGALDALIASIDDDVHRVYSAEAMTTVPLRPADQEQATERYLLFTLSGRRYAIAVPHVLEVGRLPAITPIPNVPSWLRGVINLRGEILSVIDFRNFLGLEEAHYTESHRMLVVKTLGDELTTSLIVDQVRGFVQLPKRSVQMPAFATDDKVAPYLAGVCEHENQTLAVFDLERFLLSAEVRQFE